VSFAFIDAKKATFPVRALCRALAVTPSGYYAWRARPPAARVEQDRHLTTHLRMVHAESRRTYGRPRLHRALRSQGLRVGDKRVRRLMRAAGLIARGARRFRVTTDSRFTDAVAPNRLNRAFAVAQPNRVWAGDITALWTQEGWLYLAVLIDLASRRVVGWAVRASLETDLILAALHMALNRRRIRPGIIHHSDQGSQYASHAYQRVLNAFGFIGSMSRRGNCWDNAPVESFFSSLKAELLPDHPWTTHQDAHAALADHLEVFYNRRRLHSALRYQSPADFEARWKVAV
jgi:putative transposase